MHDKKAQCIKTATAKVGWYNAKNGKMMFAFFQKKILTVLLWFL